MTPDVLKATAWTVWSAVNALAYTGLRRERGREIGLYERIPGWYVAVVVVATVALVFAVIAANLLGSR